VLCASGKSLVIGNPGSLGKGQQNGDLYIIIHWWTWPRAWLTWTDGQGSHGRHGLRRRHGPTTTTGFGRRERGWHGTWLTAGGQYARLWLVIINVGI